MQATLFGSFLTILLLSPWASARALALPQSASTIPRQERPATLDPLADAKRFYDDLDYEAARIELDRVIAGMEGATQDAATAQALANALELRAAVSFSLGDRDGSRSDFVRLLTKNPEYASSSPAISRRVLEFLDEVRRSVISHIRFVLTPGDAEIEVDGHPSPDRAGAIPVIAGPHSVTARRPGYESLTDKFVASAGTVQEVPLVLKRVSAVITLRSIPAGAKLMIRDPSTNVFQSKGITEPVPSRNQPGVGSIRLTDVNLGEYIFEFRHDCFVSKPHLLTVDELKDYSYDPVELEPAVGTIHVESTTPDSDVLLDSKSRGKAPLDLTTVCEGSHTVEVRSAYGRYVTPLELATGEVKSVRASVKPAVALLPAWDGDPSETHELLLVIERALAPVQSVTFFVPSADELQLALSGERTPTPSALGSALLRQLPRQRADLSERISPRLQVQGFAVLARAESGAASTRLSLFATGSAEPDTFDISPGDPGSTLRMVDGLNTTTALVAYGAGVLPIDVLDRPGPVVGTIDSSLLASGLARGDIIVAANGKPIVTATDFQTVVDARQSAGSVTVEAKNRSGVTNKVDLPIKPRVRVISREDHGLLFNKLAVDLRLRAAAASVPFERSAAKLNLALVLMRLENWGAALQELRGADLRAGPGISQGTVRYLMGLCYEALGQGEQAESSWRAAAQDVGSLLTDDGPEIAELVKGKVNLSK